MLKKEKTQEQSSRCILKIYEKKNVKINLAQKNRQTRGGRKKISFFLVKPIQSEGGHKDF